MSVEGDSITLVYDCARNETLHLNRTYPAELDTNGVIFIARRLLESDIFEVSICHYRRESIFLIELVTL